jgi:pimeloyl-ACP methyl ester carboxylesterase
VEFLEEFVDALCLDRFHISGNSQGMMHTVHYMVNNPERIISAALIATASLPLAVGVPAEKLVPQNPRFVYAPFEGTKESMHKMMSDIIFKKEAIDDDLLTMRTLSAVKQVDSIAAFQAGIRGTDPNLLQWADITQRLRKLTIPLIYLQGRQDVTLVLDNVIQAEPYLPNIQFFYPDQCGHQGQTDQPEMFNQVFLEFFRDGRVSRKTAEWAGISKNRPELPTVVEQ